MSQILTNSTSMHEHYLSLCYKQTDFTPVATIALTQTGAVTGASLKSVPTTLPTFGANTRVYIQVDSITPFDKDMVVTLKNGATEAGTATVVAHSPINAIFQVLKVADPKVSLTSGFTVDITNAVPGVVLKVLWLDEDPTIWYDMGMNFNEGVTFELGAMASPVARGYNATDHAKRIPQTGSFSCSQLYCSQFEGVANLSGKMIMIRDDIRTDGSAVVKESSFYARAQVQTVTKAIGGGGGATQADAVNCQGYFAKGYTWTQDAVAQTASKN